MNFLHSMNYIAYLTFQTGKMKKHILLNLQLLVIISLANLGCATLQTAFQTERIVPIFDPEATILPRSGTVA